MVLVEMRDTIDGSREFVIGNNRAGAIREYFTLLDAARDPDKYVLNFVCEMPCIYNLDITDYPRTTVYRGYVPESKDWAFGHIPHRDWRENDENPLE